MVSVPGPYQRNVVVLLVSSGMHLLDQGGCTCTCTSPVVVFLCAFCMRSYTLLFIGYTAVLLVSFVMVSIRAYIIVDLVQFAACKEELLRLVESYVCKMERKFLPYVVEVKVL